MEVRRPADFRVTYGQCGGVQPVPMCARFMLCAAKFGMFWWTDGPQVRLVPQQRVVGTSLAVLKNN